MSEVALYYCHKNLFSYFHPFKSIIQNQIICKLSAFTLSCLLFFFPQFFYFTKALLFTYIITNHSYKNALELSFPNISIIQ